MQILCIHSSINTEKKNAEQLYGKEVIDPWTYIDYRSQLCPVHKAIVVSVIHLKRPAQFMFQVSPENQVQRCHELQEVDRVVLRNQEK